MSVVTDNLNHRLTAYQPRAGLNPISERDWQLINAAFIASEPGGIR
jgi:hypothetical protein